MSETGEAVMEKRGRRDYALAEKVRMVEATLVAGTSVARVAQANGINPNLLFLWRKQYREGKFVFSKSKDRTRLLSVRVGDENLHPVEGNTSAPGAGPTTLQIELARGRVRIEGIDASCLRMVLEMLLR